MYPYPLFGNFDLYWLFILIGVIVAFIFLRFHTAKLGVPAKLYNFLLLDGAASVIIGYMAAILTQNIYHYIATGIWNWNSGATFYGGMIGGVLFFILFYFVIGHFMFKDKEHITHFLYTISACVTVIVVGHAFGRIGCLMDGCCYGIETTSWIGIHMYFDPEGVKRVPTQLIESLFLFVLFGVLSYLLVKKRNEYVISLYLIAYGVFRFSIEFVRGDNERGSIGAQHLWPSQVIAIVMVVIGVALIFAYKFFLRKILINNNEEKQN